MKETGFDPLKIGKSIEKCISRKGINGVERRYDKASSINPRNKKLKFRVSNYYRGNSVADVVGCNLKCKFCWVKDDVRDKPWEAGEFYSPVSIARNLLSNAKSAGYRYLRISGGEPTLVKEHLIQVLDELEQLKKVEQYRCSFLLETNGIILGYDNNFIERLSEFENLHVRVSLKGATPENFSFLTGAKEKFHNLQLKALKECLNNQINCHPVIMLDFIEMKEDFRSLCSTLQNIEPELIKKLEFERLFLQPHVRQRLEKNNIPYRIQYSIH